MKYCEKCRCEYEDFVEFCCDCNSPLVKYDDRKEKVIKKDNIKFSLLTNCSSNNEANMLISLLESYDIQSIHKYSGSGSYLNIIHGVNYQGVDIIVNNEQLVDAKTILDTFHYEYNDLDDEYDGTLVNKVVSNKTKIAHYILLTNVVLAIFVALMNLFTVS